MGGAGNFNDAWKDTPFTPINRPMYYFGLILLGFPVEKSIKHFFIEERTPDFAEMSLHHIAHFCLSLCNLLTNTMNYGSIVAFLHSFSDVPIAASKLLHLTGYAMPWSVIVFVIGNFVWFFQRIYCLPTAIWGCHLLQPTVEIEFFRRYLVMSNLFLSVLLFLHIYWQHIFLKMIYKAVFQKKIVDM